jgi:hypothetical protein
MNERVIIEDWPCDHSWSADKGEQCYADVTEAPAVARLIVERDTLASALRDIISERDHLAEGNRPRYPGLQDFDDWAADVAQAALEVNDG